eukprot:TRINITY_DN64518_c1_g1_i1.p2 TRINITY_DN64518_c1_g1~~TRINITY_DN64518_c1_g1_i1.p2  ORF type:complete len:192 (+),score=3.72 TRINITY_DN64518_c1_g1_i1:286-861(+)
MTSVFDSDSSLCLLRMPSASSDMSMVPSYPAATFPANPNRAPDQPLLQDSVQLLARLKEKKAKRNQKLAQVFLLTFQRQLKEELEKLEGDGRVLSGQEGHLRTLLDRVAKEGEDDLECAKRRQVTIQYLQAKQELLRNRLKSIKSSISIARSYYSSFDSLYRYWRTNGLQAILALVDVGRVPHDSHQPSSW